MTFRIAELLRPSPLILEKAVLREAGQTTAPEQTVLEKLWRTQYPATRQWRLGSALKRAFHLSIVAVARCEIQAIDQQWSLHRLAISLPGGDPDDLLAQQIPFLEVDQEPPHVDWKMPGNWWPLLQKALQAEIASELQVVRGRQEKYLGRELQRIDEYFAQYEAELLNRISRSATTSRGKSDERLAAARADHARRRNDQVSRHEIRLQPYVDALLWVAEPAWQAALEIEEERTRCQINAIYLSRARKWVRE